MQSDQPSAASNEPEHDSLPDAGESPADRFTTESEGGAPERRSHLTTALAIVAILAFAAGVIWPLVAPRPNENGGTSPALGDAAPVVLTEITPTPGWSDIDNPASDGWTTEVFSDAAAKQLKQLGKLVAHNDVRVAALAPLIDNDVTCGPLLPTERSTVLEDQAFHVERLTQPQTLEGTGKFVGPTGFGEALRLLAAPFDAAQDVRFKFKIFRIDASQPEIVTRQYFAISGRTAEGMIQQNATWDIRWSGNGGNAPPRIARIAVVDFEQVTTAHAAGPMFADCTEAVLGATPNYDTQLLRGLNYWLERGQHRRYFFRLGNPGLAVGDVNGDGLDDLYLCQEEGLPNRLFLQQTDGTAVDVSNAWQVDWLHDSRAALLIDIDNDGDQDLLVSIIGGVAVARNDNHARFTFETVVATNEDVSSLAAADYDNDGDLDVYACGYHDDHSSDEEQSVSMPITGGNFVFHDANNGGPNSLLQNDGQGTFTDVTKQVGLDVQNRRFSFAAAWEDYDNDGDQDLYVANDYGRDNLYRNDGGTFAEISDEASIEDSASGMGVTWADFDRDGRFDVHISNMWSSAGNRITFQSKFKADASDEVRTRLQRLARGNTLLQNQPDGTFRHVSGQAGVEMGRWAWSSNFVDINNDGWEDLVVANGFVTTDAPGDL